MIASHVAAHSNSKSRSTATTDNAIRMVISAMEEFMIAIRRSRDEDNQGMKVVAEHQRRMYKIELEKAKNTLKKQALNMQRLRAINPIGYIRGKTEVGLRGQKGGKSHVCFGHF